MRAIVVKVPAVGDCICYKGNTLFDCIYMVRHPEKVNRDDERALLKKQESIGGYKERLGSRIGTMTDDKYKTLNKMNIELINKDTKTCNKDTKRKLIYRMDNVWYAVIALKPKTKDTHKTQEATKENKVKSKHVNSKSESNKDTKKTNKDTMKTNKDTNKTNKDTKKTNKAKNDIKARSKNVTSLSDAITKLEISKKNEKQKKRVKVGGTSQYMNEMIQYEIELRKFLRQEYSSYYLETNSTILIADLGKQPLTKFQELSKSCYLIKPLITLDKTQCNLNTRCSPIAQNSLRAQESCLVGGEKRANELAATDLPPAKVGKTTDTLHEQKIPLPPFHNPEQKILTELKHDFGNEANFQSIIDGKFKAVSEDNYVRKIFSQKIMDNPSESEKFVLMDETNIGKTRKCFQMGNNSENLTKCKLVDLIGERAWKKMRREYSPDMEVNSDTINDFLNSFENDGNDGNNPFERKYTLGRIMDPISHNTTSFSKNNIMSIVRDDTHDYKIDYDAMTEITKDFFNKLHFNAKFKFTKHSLQDDKVFFTIQSDDNLKSVRLDQGFFTIKNVNELIDTPNNKPENIRKLFSMISNENNNTNLLLMLFKSLGDHLQIYMAKYASNLGEANTFFITSKDRIAFASAVEIDTPIIFKTNNKLLESVLSSSASPSPQKTPDDSPSSSKVYCMYTGGIDHQKEISKKDIDLINKFLSEGFMSKFGSEHELYRLHEQNSETQDLRKSIEIRANDDSKKLNKHQYTYLLKMLMNIINVVNISLDVNVNWNIFENLKDGENFSIARLKAISKNDKTKIDEEIKKLENYLNYLTPSNDNLNKLEENEFLNICRHLKELFTKNFINEDFIVKFIDHHMKGEQILKLNKYNRYIGDFEIMINEFRETLKSFGSWGTGNAPRNLEKYIKLNLIHQEIYNIFNPYYELQIIFREGLNDMKK
jgi:hypothetical protein